MTGSRPDIIPLTQANGVTLLAAGRNRTVSDNAVAPRDVSRILEALSAGNDIVVADCGAANRVLSSTLFAAQADLAVLVLRRGTSLGEARAAVASILAASRRQILVVLTGRPASPVPGWISKTASASAEVLAANLKKLRNKNSTGSTNHDRESAQKAPDNTG
jgi:MinD-like ATPase involved in chromosome partitioning or flagellar assembly